MFGTVHRGCWEKTWKVISIQSTSDLETLAHSSNSILAHQKKIEKFKSNWETMRTTSSISSQKYMSTDVYCIIFLAYHYERNQRGNAPGAWQRQICGLVPQMVVFFINEGAEAITDTQSHIHTHVNN